MANDFNAQFRTYQKNRQLQKEINEVFKKHGFATRPAPRCDECGVVLSMCNEVILRDDLWRTIRKAKHYFLCFMCVEKALGRPVVPADLKPCGMTVYLRLGHTIFSRGVTPGDLDNVKMEVVKKPTERINTMRRNSLIPMTLLFVAALAVPGYGQSNTVQLTPLTQAVNKAKGDAGIADAAVNTAQVALRTARNATETTYKSTPAWLAARQAIDAAQAALDAATKRVKAGLVENPDYKAAIENKTKAEIARDAARSTGPLTFDQTQRLATAVLAANGGVSKLENDAMGNDPEVVKARKELVDANHQQNALAGKMEGVVRADPAWIAAKGDLDKALADQAVTKAVLHNAESVYADEVRRQQALDAAAAQKKADDAQRRQQQAAPTAPKGMQIK